MIVEAGIFDVEMYLVGPEQPDGPSVLANRKELLILAEPDRPDAAADRHQLVRRVELLPINELIIEKVGGVDEAHFALACAGDEDIDRLDVGQADVVIVEVGDLLQLDTSVYVVLLEVPTVCAHEQVLFLLAEDLAHEDVLHGAGDIGDHVAIRLKGSEIDSLNMLVLNDNEANRAFLVRGDACNAMSTLHAFFGLERVEVYFLQRAFRSGSQKLLLLMRAGNEVSCAFQLGDPLDVLSLELVQVDLAQPLISRHDKESLFILGQARCGHDSHDLQAADNLIGVNIDDRDLLVAADEIEMAALNHNAIRLLAQLRRDVPLIAIVLNIMDLEEIALLLLVEYLLSLLVDEELYSWLQFLDLPQDLHGVDVKHEYLGLAKINRATDNDIQNVKYSLLVVDLNILQRLVMLVCVL